LSKFYSLLEKHDEAVEHAKKVCELEPEDSFNFVAMSMICQKADRTTEAEQAMMKAQMAAQRSPR
jgi:Flp pilus assembly protein TadD